MSDVTWATVERRLDKMDQSIDDLKGNVERVNAQQKAAPTYEQVSNIRNELENRFSTALDKFTNSLAEKLGNERQATLAEVDKVGASLRELLKDEIDELQKELSKEFHDMVHEILPAHVSKIVEERSEKTWQKFRQRGLTVIMVVTVIVGAWGWLKDIWPPT